MKDYDRMRMIEAFNAPAKSPTQEAYERVRADGLAAVVAWLRSRKGKHRDIACNWAMLISRGDLLAKPAGSDLREREGGEG